jgi:hypothetical protein
VDELVADERSILLVALVVGVRGRKKATQGRVVRIAEQRLELVEQVAKEQLLVRVEAQPHASVTVAANLTVEQH